MTDAERYRLAVRRVVRRLRRQAGLTVAEVAAAWACLPSNVSHAEAGRKAVSTEQLRALGALVGREPASILTDVALELLRIKAERGEVTPAADE